MINRILFLFLAFADMVLHRHRRSLLSGEDKWVFLKKYFQKGNENHNLKFRNAAPKKKKQKSNWKLLQQEEKPKEEKELREKEEVGVEFNLPVDLLPFGSWPLSVLYASHSSVPSPMDTHVRLQVQLQFVLHFDPATPIWTPNLGHCLSTKPIKVYISCAWVCVCRVCVYLLLLLTRILIELQPFLFFSFIFYLYLFFSVLRASIFACLLALQLQALRDF